MNNPGLHRLLAQARLDDFRRARSERVHAERPVLRATRALLQSTVTLRLGFPDDVPPLARLAALDSAAIPAAPVLLAEVGGELLAALSLADGATISDPFHATAPLLELLRARARQLDGDGHRQRGIGRFGLLARLRLTTGAQTLRR